MDLGDEVEVLDLLILVGLLEILDHGLPVFLLLVIVELLRVQAVDEVGQPSMLVPQVPLPNLIKCL